MADVLIRMKRERRWAIGLFLAGVALIFGVQIAFAPRRGEGPSATARVEQVEPGP